MARDKYGEIRPEYTGDVFSDRLSGHWPRMKGYEVREEAGEGKEAPYRVGARGDVFSDRLFSEWQRLYGYEIIEEKHSEKP